MIASLNVLLLIFEFGEIHPANIFKELAEVGRVIEPQAIGNLFHTFRRVDGLPFWLQG